MIDLTTFRDAVLGEAHREAEALLAEADAAAELQLDEARSETQQVLTHARERGREAAEHELRQRIAGGRQRARETVLRARRDILDELRRRAIARLLDLRDHDAYGDLCDRLGRAARGQLGADATITEDDADGGVVGHTDHRRVDYRIPALVDFVLEDMAGELEELWR